ncbi:MAG: hypothetical protein WAQ07_05615 [Candidatus Omnitrophota bacterium]
MAKLVNWHRFENSLKEKGQIIFTPLDIRRILKISKVSATFLIHRYAKKGFIQRLKRGVYSFPDTSIPDVYLANKLYAPSYVSLEFALSFYRIIPEVTYEITSVTTKPTRKFSAQDKIFSFRKIKKEAFGGYYLLRKEGINGLIAEPEKALVDLLYLSLRSKKKKGFLLRINRQLLNVNKALRYAKLFKDKKLTPLIKELFK